MRLLRAIFNHHLFNPKCVSSSRISFGFLQTATTDQSPEVEEPQTQTSSSSSWSMYSHMVDHIKEDGKPSVRVTKTKARGGSGRSTIGTMKKEKTQWVCCNCGHSVRQWWGVCPSCNIPGTMKVFHEAKSADADNKVRTGLAISEDAVGLWLPQKAAELRPLKLEEVNRGFNQQQWRIPLSGSFGNEVSTVLGGGLVPGSILFTYLH